VSEPDQIERIFRDEWSRLLASLIGYVGDFDLAEESAAEAFAIAARRWPSDGLPDNPAAWLVTAARRRAIDRVRRDRVLAAKLPLLAADLGDQEITVPAEATVIPDERLELIFMCCHPALATEAQVALTLRAVGGLPTEDIARAFLVPSDTMKRRLSRAKAKIKLAGIPFSVPSGPRLAERLGAVLSVIYLIFNEGYGDPDRPSLAADAIRLGRVLSALLPGQPEVLGLLALMLLHDARREARFDGPDLVLLADQDRSRWHWRQIDEARALLDRALLDRALLDRALLDRALLDRALSDRARTDQAPAGPYVLQAAIASLQAEEQLDWPQIAVLYTALAERTGSPVVRLNRAVAVAEADGPAAALALVEELDLPRYQYWHSTRAELLRRLGRPAEARASYQRAQALARTEAERRFLTQRAADL
jgi:RNA polymerase sigma-70 factor (ECF subfamily)